MQLVQLLLPIVSIISTFSFTAVVVWLKARRREREAFYKSETIKKIAETPGTGASGALEYLREQEKMAAQRRREGLILGGMVNAAIGIGVMIFLYKLVPGRPIYFVGLIPLLIGVALVAYSYFLAPKEARASS